MKTPFARIAKTDGGARPAGLLSRIADGWRQQLDQRTSVILPQYTRPGRPGFVVGFAVILAVACYLYGFGFSLTAPIRATHFIAPLGVLLMLMVWALPELGAAPTRLLERLFFAFLISTALWPSYLAITLPGLPWINMARLIGFPLVLVLAISISISRQFRDDTMQSLETIPSLWKMVAAFGAIQIITIPLSGTPQFSIQKVIIYSISWIAMFFVAAYAFRKPKSGWFFIAIIVTCGVILTGIAIRERQVGQILWANSIPSWLSVDDPSVQRMFGTTGRAGTNIYRSQAIFATPLALGEYLALCTPFILHMVAGPGFRLWIRALGLVLLPVIFFGILTTDTRLGVVGYIMSIGIYIFLWGLLRWRENPRGLIGPAVVLSYPATAMAFIVAVLSFNRLRVMTIGGGKHQASTEARYDQWAEGIPLVFQHPWGHGAARGAGALGFRNPAGTLTIDSYWLAIGLDYGVLGFVTFYGAFLVAVAAGLRTVARGVKSRELALIVPLTIALFVYFVIKSIYAGTENQPIAFMMLGAMSALVYRARLEQGPEVPKEKKTKRKKGVILA
ncbi:O-antigen ligase family protein [Phenylobacterium kunshanense]|uniref:O-antigen ligase-related domain-containing protein n=1 Tax=Phenylobacterium kunshanense TaxID=1445034 RepID=A0A328BHE3_9CAUL|nr:O-antigen ligase family protein [Phenylobacterium kunshanense]RAK66543.1 hypothetical protein DJ019_09910 [Phenylobacterium kunshanense]